jgi:hypothetical protein
MTDPQEQAQQQVVQPAPVNQSFLVGVLPHPTTGKQTVVIQILTNEGSRIYWLEPNRAKELGQVLIDNAAQAGSDIQIARSLTGLPNWPLQSPNGSGH